MVKKTIRKIWVLASAIAASHTYAQITPPDAGVLIQQVPRPGLFQPTRPVLPAESQPQPQSAARAPSSKVRVLSFKVQGNLLLSQEQLAPIFAPYLNQLLDLGQLEQVAQALAQRYREDGWVVSAYLPSQDVTQGEVLIQIEEAKLGNLRLSAPDGLQGSQALAQRYFDALLSAGQPLNADAVDRAQLLSNELLGLDVVTHFKKGQSVGTTDVEVGLRDKPALAADLFADNAGARATGRARLNAMMELRNPMQGSDIWNLALMHTEGSDNMRVGVGVPLGDLGWRVGVSAAQYQFRVIAPEFAALNIKGDVQTVGLEASYPWLRQRDRSLSLLVSADRKTMDNRSNASITSHYRTQSGTVALQGRENDWLGGGGSTYGQLGLTAGRLNLNGSPNQATDALGAGTEGSYTKWRGTLSRLQNLSTNWTLQLSHTAQLANRNLDSSEKLFIGGADSVRAFPVSEAGGARGHVSSLELSWRLDGETTLFGFYDYGQVRVNVNNAYAQAPELNRISLQGAGLGAQWRAANGLQLKLSWARRLKENSHPNTNGYDQDGSLLRDRVWASALYNF
jgi:hemolysin activation/secretion protein